MQLIFHIFMGMFAKLPNETQDQRPRLSPRVAAGWTN